MATPQPWRWAIVGALLGALSAFVLSLATTEHITSSESVVCRSWYRGDPLELSGPGCWPMFHVFTPGFYVLCVVGAVLGAMVGAVLGDLRRQASART